MAEPTPAELIELFRAEVVKSRAILDECREIVREYDADEISAIAAMAMVEGALDA
jgi:hypothetical protein